MGGGGVKKHRRINKTLGGEKAQKLDSWERSRVRGDERWIKASKKKCIHPEKELDKIISPSLTKITNFPLFSIEASDALQTSLHYNAQYYEN